MYHPPHNPCHPKNLILTIHTPVIGAVVGVIGLSTKIGFFEVIGALIVVYSIAKIFLTSSKIKP